jgi:hypothetical protein
MRITKSLASRLHVSSALSVTGLAQMMALSADRNTPSRDGVQEQLGVAATKKFYAGALVCVNSSGYATPGAASAALVAVGRAEAAVDNTSGADGDVKVNFRRGVFRFANSATTDAIAAADIGTDCYIVDDQTVAKTSNSGARSVAGRIVDVDAQGVWVLVGYGLPKSATTVKPGMQFAAGEVALDGSNPTTVATGLTALIGAVAVLKGTAAPGDSTSVLTVNFAGTDGNLDIYGWKNTGGTDPTLVASTGTETVEWIAWGYR